MPSSHPRRFLGRALPSLLVVPLVVVPAIAYLTLSAGGQGGGLPVAQGATGGGFHPVAGGFAPDTTRLDTCGERYSCLEQAFGNIAYREGP